MPRLRPDPVPAMNAAGAQAQPLSRRRFLRLGLLAGVWLPFKWPGEQLANAATLAAALSLLHDGYHEEAASALQSLLFSRGSPSSSVLVPLGECYEALGRWGAAAVLWQLAAKVVPAEANTFLFRRAAALEAAGSHASAARLYSSYLLQEPLSPARREAAWRAAQCLEAIRDFKGAAEHYQLALSLSANYQEWLQALHRTADALVLMGQPLLAIAIFSQAEPKVEPGDRPWFLYRWALAERAAGLAAQALSRLRTVFESYPQSWAAYASLLLLLDAGEAVDDYQRGVVDYYAGVYDRAVEALQRHIAADPQGHRGSAHYYAGLSYRALGEYQLALREFDWLIETHPGDPLIPAAILAKAETQAQMGLPTQAIQLERALAASYPQHELAPVALGKAAALAASLGDRPQAIELYQQLYQQYPQSAAAQEAPLRAALLSLVQGDRASAVAHLRAGLSQSEGSTAALAVRFWLGRLLLEAGSTDEATPLLQSAAAGPPSFYAYRAQLLLQGVREAVLPARGSALLEPPAQWQAEAESQLQQLDPSWRPGDLPAALRQNASFQAGQKLLRLGLRSQAQATLLALARSLDDQPLCQYSLALWAKEAWLYRLSIQCAARLLAALGSQAPRFVRALAYPTYYGHLALAECQRWGVDPLLFLALIRQESLFDPTAGSSAGAQGLAQIMPATGEWIAEQLGEPFQEADLLRPHVSIRYGAFYLAKQLELFGGDVLAALAAYNAGPGNALAWARRAGSDPDLFYEAVSFQETKTYLGLVLWNYHQYRALYSA